VQLGGDTDTNACIVGGLVGALVGVHNVDPHMLDTLLSFDCQGEGIRRPAFLSVKAHAVDNIQKLIEVRPLKRLVIEETPAPEE